MLTSQDTTDNANAFASTFYFFANAQAYSKKIKRACKQLHKISPLRQTSTDQKEERTANRVACSATCR